MQKRTNELNWMEGTPGKGIVLHDGEVETWTTREDGNPIHTEYCGLHHINWDEVVVAFDIDPSGGVWSFLKDEIGPEAGKIIHQADPRLDASSAASDQWHLGAGQIYKEHRGLTLHDGTEHQWPADDGRTHINYMLQNGIDPSDVADYWAIYNDGDRESLTSYYGDWYRDEYNRVTNKPRWNFGKTAEIKQKLRFSQDEGDILNWDEGNEGKGIIDRSGHVYTWNNDDYEVHQDFLRDHPDVVPMLYFWIEPNGQVRGAGLGDELSGQDEELLRDADPRLFTKAQEANAWSFA